MPQKAIAVLSAVAASWGICAFSYAVQGGGSYDGLFFFFVWIAAFLTIAAAVLVVRAWRGTASLLAVTAVSLLASVSILWLALAIGLRG